VSKRLPILMKIPSLGGVARSAGVGKGDATPLKSPLSKGEQEVFSPRKIAAIGLFRDAVAMNGFFS
jgi:hypothetical protein